MTVLLHSQGFTDTMMKNYHKFYQAVTYLKQHLAYSV